MYEYAVSNEGENSLILFADIHIFYAISRVNAEKAHQIYNLFLQKSLSSPSPIDHRFSSLFLPFVRSLLAFHGGKIKEALDEVAHFTADDLLLFGGSHPQRRLFSVCFPIFFYYLLSFANFRNF